MGIFVAAKNVEEAHRRLREAGFERSQLSILMRADASPLGKDGNTDRPIDLGGAAGAAIRGLLAGAIALAIPGIGTPIGVGRIAAV